MRGWGRGAPTCDGSGPCPTHFDLTGGAATLVVDAGPARAVSRLRLSLGTGVYRVVNGSGFGTPAPAVTSIGVNARAGCLTQGAERTLSRAASHWSRMRAHSSRSPAVRRGHLLVADRRHIVRLLESPGGGAIDPRAVVHMCRSSVPNEDQGSHLSTGLVKCGVCCPVPRQERRSHNTQTGAQKARRHSRGERCRFYMVAPSRTAINSMHTGPFAHGLAQAQARLTPVRARSEPER